MSFRLTLHQPSRIAPLLFLAACATTTPPAARSSQDAPRVAPRRIPDARGPITAVDIAGTSATNVYDAVRTLRANFLHSRGITTLQRADGGAWPAVFVDGMYLGNVSELRDIPASTVHEVRFVSAADATVLYGMGYAAGVILVTTKR